MTPADIATLAPGEALVVMNQKWQIVRAGGSLIPAWLDILRTRRTPVQGFLEPREIQRPTLNLAEVDDLIAWRRETKAALKRTRGQGAANGDDDDDDDSPTYALGGPSWS